MAADGKKQVPLRLSPKLYAAIAAWAEDDFRSVNGQIEYLLTECVRQRKKKRQIRLRRTRRPAGAGHLLKYSGSLAPHRSKAPAVASTRIARENHITPGVAIQARFCFDHLKKLPASFWKQAAFMRSMLDQGE